MKKLLVLALIIVVCFNKRISCGMMGHSGSTSKHHNTNKNFIYDGDF